MYYFYLKKGTFIWPDGRKYIGDWKANKMDGEGIFSWPNGCRYEGHYSQDKRNGEGTYYWLNNLKS